MESPNTFQKDEKTSDLKVEMDAAKLHADGVELSTTKDSARAKELTPEEQMALYEEHLKETDCGHRPC